MEMGPLKNWELPRATAGCDRSRIRGFFESSSVITDTAVVCAIFAVIFRCCWNLCPVLLPITSPWADSQRICRSSHSWS